ncbi:MAG: WecB/TagA/CpsF family glycosyltransferase, partial [Patescibacteria group bacterium]
PDGVGIVWGCRLSVVSCKLAETIPGIDFMEELVALAAEKGYPVAFIGGSEGVAQKALENLQKKYPGLQGWAETPPEINSLSNLGDLRYLSDVANKIRRTGVRFIFVGLGAPKQEFFIKELQQYLSLRGEERRSNLNEIATAISWPRNDSVQPNILMSVGGSFDELSGKIPQAPKWISDLGMKWLWRLIIEPWRIGRQLKLIKFVWLVLTQKVSGKI